MAKKNKKHNYSKGANDEFYTPDWGENKNKHNYSKGGNDECYTPGWGVRPILPFIPKGKVVWCPFDKEDSEFVKLIQAQGNIVIHSHIDEGKDFFKYEPPEWDIMVSNPPFTNKRLFYKRALSFGKPFALIVTTQWFHDAAPVHLFKMHEDLQLLMLDKRIEYHNYKGERPPFASWYLCYDFLPRQIVAVSVDKQPSLNF